MFIQEYQNNQNRSLSSKELEYEIFSKAVRQLTAAEEAGFETSQYKKAVNDNRDLWKVLLNDSMSPENLLPGQVRTSVMTLSLWVDNYSQKALESGVTLEPLIEINQAIVDGMGWGNQQQQ